MRKFVMLLAVLALPVVAVPSIAATSPPSEQELLLIKKKKAEAARKAAEAKSRAEARKQAAAKASATPPRVVAVVRTDVVRPRAAAGDGRSAGTVRRCDGFLSCLFGRKPRPGVQRASTGRAAVSDYATAEDVSWSPAAKYAPGSIVVQTPERALYLVLGDGQARRYSVGVGREGFQWSGNSRIVNKAEWPTWRPPQVMIEREAAKGHMLPDVMEGGPDNPLGARAMYIGGTMYRIHGTNNAGSIGGAVSSGCIRMMNTDVVDLYDRVKIGARVYVFQ